MNPDHKYEHQLLNYSEHMKDVNKTDHQYTKCHEAIMYLHSSDFYRFCNSGIPTGVHKIRYFRENQFPDAQLLS